MIGVEQLDHNLIFAAGRPSTLPPWLVISSNGCASRPARSPTTAPKTRDAALYRVHLPNVSYDGHVLVTGMRDAALDTEEWIAREFNDRAARSSHAVVIGQLYTLVDLTDR
jgi:hypothetical protein